MQSRFFKRMYEKTISFLTFIQEFFVSNSQSRKIECPQSPSFLVPKLRRRREAIRAIGTKMGGNVKKYERAPGSARLLFTSPHFPARPKTPSF